MSLTEACRGACSQASSAVGIRGRHPRPRLLGKARRRVCLSREPALCEARTAGDRQTLTGPSDHEPETLNPDRRNVVPVNVVAVKPETLTGPTLAAASQGVILTARLRGLHG